MKIASFSLALLLSAFSLFAADAAHDLGKVMFVGDSISHGYASASYRWALHKLFVDNGMSYESLGIMTGNQPGQGDGVAPGTLYAGVAFTNTHSAQSSARAWEISGRKSGQRFKGTNIMNWLGQATTTCAGANYTDATYEGDDAPQYFFMMIGTNDLLSDHGNKLESVAKTAVPDLQKDVDDIIKSMRKANKNASITLTTIPVWAHRNGIDAPATHTTVEKYNEAMKKSAKSRKVKVAEINEGLRDLSNERPFHGHADLFAPDGLHPNDQGSLIIAGNVAQCMGWAGRTAGLERKGAADFALSFAKDKTAFTLNDVKTKGASMQLSAKAGSTVQCEMPEAAPQTVELKLHMGDGAKNGWSTEDELRITLATDHGQGTLSITEAYLKWGNQVIYCGDMSKLTEPLRITSIAGDAKANIKGGFYIWLGDTLVGEALPSQLGDAKGMLIELTGKTATAVISGLAVDSISTAPTTK